MYRRRRLFTLGCPNRRLGRLFHAVSFERRNLHNRTAKFFAQRRYRNLISIFANQIRHIDCQNNRNPKLHQLCRQIQISLNVRTVHNIQNRVRSLGDQIISRHNLLQCIGGERINSGKIHDRHIFCALYAQRSFQFTFFFFHGNAWPVADKLIGAGEGIKQRGLSTVWVAR